MSSETDASQFGKGFVETPHAAYPVPTADTPLAELDPSHPELFAGDRWKPVFARLREEAPVHHVADSAYGPYWCLSSYEAIVDVSSRPDTFSSSYKNGGFTIQDMANDPASAVPMFIAMDAPEHTAQRKSVAPAFAPSEIKRLEKFVRQRTGELFDRLPVEEEFDWVDRVSIELTTGMLAILFDFPWEERRKLTFWSDWMADTRGAVDPAWREKRGRILFEAAAFFSKLWAERKASGAADLISMMARSEAFAETDQRSILGALMLLIVGGNDTTRNAMSGAALFMNQFPEMREELEGNIELVPAAFSETHRMQSPLPHMRRTATEDTELFGHDIKAGDKIVMWHISGNHDESVFPDADRWDLHRENTRRQIAFGHGVHRCIGQRLAEMQMSVLLEELITRRLRVVAAGEPSYIVSNFVHGIRKFGVTLERY
ncbi:MAG: cytochrome P450 [Sphingomonadaceae bacterium]|nr:cytochrome P450 [Sphingomonadaceae bacterium]